MKHSHISTPRTLAACTFETGYASVQPPQRGRIRGWLLSASIGAGLAWWLVTWWSQA